MAYGICTASTHRLALLIGLHLQLFCFVTLSEWNALPLDLMLTCLGLSAARFERLKNDLTGLLDVQVACTSWVWTPTESTKPEQPFQGDVQLLLSWQPQSVRSMLLFSSGVFAAILQCHNGRSRQCCQSHLAQCMAMARAASATFSLVCSIEADKLRVSPQQEC